MQFNNSHRIQRGFLKSVSVPFNLVRILETSTYGELDFFYLYNFVYRVLKTVSFTKLRKIGELWKNLSFLNPHFDNIFLH